MQGKLQKSSGENARKFRKNNTGKMQEKIQKIREMRGKAGAEQGVGQREGNGVKEDWTRRNEGKCEE
eukprot:13144-Rhodomonas_salina.2